MSMTTFIITPLLTSTFSFSFIKLIIFQPVLDTSVERYLYASPFKSISPSPLPSFETISKIFLSSTFVWTFDISLLSDNIVPSLFIKTEYPVWLKLFSEKLIDISLKFIFIPITPIGVSPFFTLLYIVSAILPESLSSYGPTHTISSFIAFS